MKTLKRFIHALFRQSCNPVTIPAKRIPEEQRMSDLQKIEDFRKLNSIQRLVTFLFSNDQPVVEAAVKAIESVVQSTMPLALSRFEFEVRQAFQSWRVSLDALSPAEAVRLSRGSPAVLGIFSFHANGYVREATVSALAEVWGGQELPFLLIRANDWVNQVSEAAIRAIEARTRPDYAGSFVRALPLVFRARGQARAKPIAENILKLLPIAARQTLREMMRSTDRAVRRLAFTLLTEPPGDDEILVLTEALANDDILLNIKAARALRRRLKGQALREMLDRLISDSRMPIRREGQYGFIENLPEQAAPVLEAALLDRNRSMREAARFYLRQSAERDFAGFYRDRLNDAPDRELPTIIAGLGETGTPGDAERLTDFLSHPVIRVRREAIQAIGRLDPEGSFELLLKALQDPSPGVAKAARDVLQLRPFLLLPERLSSIFEATPTRHVRLLVLSLAGKLPWWDAAPVFILASSSDDEYVRQLATNFLHAWKRNRRPMSTDPNADQAARLNAAVDRSRSFLDDEILKALDAVPRRSVGSDCSRSD